MLILVLAGCGVQIDGAARQADEPDAATASEPDAEVEPDATTPNMPADAGTTIPSAACMAKGYAAVGTLTSLYRTSTNSNDWLDAEAACAADVPGATHLVVLSSTAEVQYIQTKLGWVGLSDGATENVFVNVTAEPNDLRPWISGQPDNGGGNENCVRMKSAGLDDDQCNNSHAYVCECDGRAPTP